MQAHELTKLVEEKLSCTRVTIEGDGRHFEAMIVSDDFVGLSKLKRQQAVYAALGNLIATGEVHAFTMKTYTEEEWRNVEC